MYLNFDKMRRTLDQQSIRDKSSCWTKSETVPLFWIPLSLQVTSRKYTSRKLSGAVFCNMSINNYMNVHTGIPPRFLQENQNSSFTDTFNKYQAFNLTQKITLEMPISLITYCFPSAFFFTSKAFPNEPSPIFFTRTYRSISKKKPPRTYFSPGKINLSAFLSNCWKSGGP